jgi:heme-degrading monooxygenase HmoA
MVPMPTRVVRVWKGYGTSGGVQRYCDDHFAKTVLPQLRALSGFESATVLVRPVGHETEVVVATVWASMQSVKTFAGDDHDAAVVEPVVRTLLDHFDTRVTHFNVALSA